MNILYRLFFFFENEFAVRGVSWNFGVVFSFTNILVLVLLGVNLCSFECKRNLHKIWISIHKRILLNLPSTHTTWLRKLTNRLRISNNLILLSLILTLLFILHRCTPISKCSPTFTLMFNIFMSLAQKLTYILISTKLQIYNLWLLWLDLENWSRFES